MVGFPNRIADALNRSPINFCDKRVMFGRYLGIVTLLAVFSITAAGIAGRAPERNATEADTGLRGNHDNWTTHQVRKGQSMAAAEAAGRSGSPGEALLSRSRDSHFYADADIDGTTIRVMVDSGASVVALTRADAEAIGIDVDRLPVAGMAQTAGGQVPMRVTMLDSIDIDGVEVRRVQAAVIDADMGVSLLGQSYLSRLSTVNVEGDTMTLR